MRKLGSYLVLLTILMFSVAFLSSCFFPAHEAENNEYKPVIEYDELTKGFFRGGMLKLSYLSEKSTIKFIGTSGRFGYIVVKNPKNFESEVAVFNDDGDLYKLFDGLNLMPGKAFDFDEDGVKDLIVQKDYFEFFQDESKNIYALYDYNYPKGILYEYETGEIVYGSDPNNFKTYIYENYLPDASGVYFLKNEKTNSLKVGDILFDVSSYRFTEKMYIRKIKKIKDKGDFIFIESEELKFEEVFPISHLRIVSSLSDAEDLENDTSRSTPSSSLVSYESSKTLYSSAHATLTAFYGFFMDADVEVSMDTSWKSFSFEVDLPLSANHYLNLDLIASGNYKKSDEKDPFYEPKYAFVVYGVPVVVSIPMYLGYSFEATGTAHATVGYNLDAYITPHAELSGSLSFSGISISKDWNYTHSANAERIGPKYEVNGEANFKGYIGVDVKVSIATIGYTTFKNKPYLNPQAVGILQGDPYPDASVTTLIPYGIDFSISIGYDFKAKKDHWDKHIKDWKIGKFGPWCITFPAQPSDLQIERNYGKISLSWTDNSSYEDGFIIEKHKKVEGSWQKEDTYILSKNATSYTDTSASEEFTYKYSVYSYSDWPMEFRYTSNDIQAKSLAIPYLMHATPYDNSASKYPDLKWRWTEGIGQNVNFTVMLFRYINNTLWPETSHYLNNVTNDKGYFTFPLENLRPSTTYYWKIIGENQDGETAESMVASFTTISDNEKYLYIISHNDLDENLSGAKTYVMVGNNSAVTYTTPATILVNKGDTINLTARKDPPDSSTSRSDHAVLFQSWDDNGSTEPNRSILVDYETDRDLTMSFLAAEYYKLSISTNPNGLDAVQIYLIDGEQRGEFLKENSQVKLQAKPVDGYVFDHWEGSINDIPLIPTSENPINILITGPTEITAFFTEE